MAPEVVNPMAPSDTMTAGLELLLRRTGAYERAHQLVLLVLFENGLGELLGLPPAAQVHLEHERGLFDLALDHGSDRTTGVGLKVSTDFSQHPPREQRFWAEQPRHEGYE